MGALDQAGQKMGNASMMDMAKGMYGGLFDSLKGADALALNLDFSAEGLGVDGQLAIKADSAAARSIAGAKSGDGSAIAKLPADSSYFVYMNLDAKTFESFQKMGMMMLSAGGKPTPELEAALARQREAGRVEVLGAVTIGNGMRTFNLMNVSDPKALVATSEATIKALKESDSPVNIYKDVKITPKAETHAGFTFTRIELTIDSDKLAKLPAGNPAGVGGMRAIFGGDKVTTWYGASDTQMLHVVALEVGRGEGLDRRGHQGQR